MRLLVRTLLLLLLPVGMAVGAARAEDAVKAGKWEFSSQLNLPNTPQLPPGASLPEGAKASAGGASATHSQCVDPEKAVPSDPRRGCKIEHMQRGGALITWTTTCDSPQGKVESKGSARYHGNTMEANMNTRLPNGSGGFITTTQHITGRYLGPCDGR